MLLVGTLSYNGIPFGGSSHVTLQMETVQDDAHRTTTYVRHRLTVQLILHDPSDTGDTFITLRQKLMETGQALIFEGQGAGSFSVNAGAQRDVKFGPHPRILGWAPVGSLRACEVQWQVEFNLPSCVFVSLSQANPFLAFNFGVSYQVDYKGATSRTVSGYFEIPLTRFNRSIPDTADSYRSLITLPIPSEFQRTTQNFNLSADKSRLDFTLVDSEIPSDNPYPKGVAKIDARHSVSWSKYGGGLGGVVGLSGRISVSIELGFNQPTSIAYNYFVRIVKDRFLKSTQYGQRVFLMSVSAEEGIFDRTSSFSVSYRILCANKKSASGSVIPNDVADKMVERSGMFTALASSPTWNEWALSMVPVNNVGGYQHLTMSASSDAIVDVCGPSPEMPWAPQTSSPSDNPPYSPDLGLYNTTPTSQGSWLVYQDVPTVFQVSPSCRQSILQAPHSAPGAVDMDAIIPTPPTGATSLQTTYPTAEGTPDVIQVNGQPRYYCLIRGFGRRAGYPIAHPSYPTIGAANTTLKKDQFSPWTQGMHLGVPVTCATWELLYELDRAPGQVDNLVNVEQGV